jgi:hypothetical protein
MLEGQLADLNHRIARIKAELETNPDLDLLLDTVAKLAESRKAAAHRLDRAREKRVNGEPEHLAQAQSLADMLDAATGDEHEALRSRLQSAIRSLASHGDLAVGREAGHAQDGGQAGLVSGVVQGRHRAA